MEEVAERSSAGQSLQHVQFRLASVRVPGARGVALVGSFNHWDASAHCLMMGPDGWWCISLWLPPGQYPYLFIVDGFPFNDPEDDRRIPCEWGGHYSVSIVT